jgi:GNAT superfamily N-acetyltransferase
MIDVVPLTVDDAAEVAAFTRVACPYDLLTTTSVQRSIFADTGAQEVLAVYGTGLEAVGAGVVRGERGWVKFLAVHPTARRRGVGTQLLARIEAFCRRAGARTIEMGTSAPYYTVPGVDVRLMEAIALLHRAGYERCGEAFNLTVPLRFLPEPPLDVRRADNRDLAALRPWVSEHFPHWLNELERGVSLGTCVVHEDAGFACYDVNREGWFGPIATRPGLGRRGIGTATLLGALHAMRKRGYKRADIAWATAEDFYGKAVGARVGRVFWWFRKELPTGP